MIIVWAGFLTFHYNPSKYTIIVKKMFAGGNPIVISFDKFFEADCARFPP